MYCIGGQSCVFETPTKQVLKQQDKTARQAMTENSNKDNSKKTPKEAASGVEEDVDDIDMSETQSAKSSVTNMAIAPKPELISTKAQSPVIRKRSIDTMKSDSAPNNGSGNYVGAGKKVPSHLLEKRRLGRIKAAEEFSKKLKDIGIEKIENNNTTSFIKPINVINLKNYSSNYLKTDEQVSAMREKKKSQQQQQQQQQIASSQTDITSLPEKLPAIVIDPGSEFLKIGFSTDEHPVIIPNCIATLKQQSESDNEEVKPAQDEVFDIKDTEVFLEEEKSMRHNFIERMRYYKRKISPHEFRNQVLNFNSKHANTESIPIKQDIHRPAWINGGEDCLHGKEASLCDPKKYDIRYPFANMHVNGLIDPYYKKYSSDLSPPNSIWNDIYSILVHTLNTHLGLKFQDFKKYNIVLVVPDLYTRSYVKSFAYMIFNELGFSQIAFMKQSVSITYGAGLSQSSCIVDIGSGNTKISCLVDGSVISNSEVLLNYGSSDLDIVLGNFLRKMEFPMQFDMSSRSGHYLLENLKKQYCTFEDSDVTVQLFSNCIKYAENKDEESLKTDFKIFDEVFLTPLSLFYPKIIKEIHSRQKFVGFDLLRINQSYDPYTWKPNNPTSKSQTNLLNKGGYCDSYEERDIIEKIIDVLQDDKSKGDNEDIDGTDEEDTDDPQTLDNSLNYCPLDKAIIESIINATISGQQYSKLKNFYNNILVVGGGSNIPNLDVLLSDRLNIYRPRFLATNYFPIFLKTLEANLKKLNTVVIENGELKQDRVYSMDDIIRMTLNEYQTKQREVVERKKHAPGADDPDDEEVVLPVNIIPCPMDPQVISWKGGCVFASIKLIDELYVTKKDWDDVSCRLLFSKYPFECN